MEGNIMQHKWMDEEYRNAAWHLIRLLGVAMNERDPGIVLPDGDRKLSVLSDIARSNGGDGLAFCAFKYMPKPPRPAKYMTEICELIFPREKR